VIALHAGDKLQGEFIIAKADEFEYRDPVDGSVSSHQVSQSTTKMYQRTKR
jgi:hypothetical protein